MEARETVNRRRGSIRAKVDPGRPNNHRWWRPRLQTVPEDEILKIVWKKGEKP
jgi:hypothetical protein